MTSYSKHKEEAWKLIEFLSNPEQNLVFSKAVGLIPIHTTAAQDEFFNKGAYQPFIAMNEKPNEYFMIRDATNYQGYGESKKIAVEDNQALILKKLTTEQVLGNWDKYWNKEKENQQK